MKMDVNCAAISDAGSWSEPTRGWASFVDCWFVMSSYSPPIERFSILPACGLHSGGIFETRSSQNGSIAVFPGTTVISEPDWSTSSRPWWKQTFGGQLHLGSDGLWQVGDRLTVAYLDVLTNTPILVRTYLRKIKIGSQEFVLGIDLYHRDDQPFVALNILGVDMAAPPWQVRFALACIMSFILFGVVRWIAPPARQSFVFERDRSIYGNLTAERLLDFLNDEEIKTATGWKLTFGKQASCYN